VTSDIGPRRFGDILGHDPTGVCVVSGVAGAAAWIECDIDAVHPAGDHVILVGRVRDLAASADRRPPIFLRGGFGRFGPFADGGRPAE
jgi:flavin reductase (DIM6/NTAB) family NADH-FMN oxidoreductase RutF